MAYYGTIYLHQLFKLAPPPESRYTYWGFDHLHPGAFDGGGKNHFDKLIPLRNPLLRWEYSGVLASVLGNLTLDLVKSAVFPTLPGVGHE